MHNTQIPKSLIPYEKIRKARNKRQYVHFYMHDKGFRNVLTDLKRHIWLFQQFDGIITPDPTLDMKQSRCLQQTTVWFRQAVGSYCQRHGIPVIPNIRFGTEKTYDFCFLGVPRHSIVAISTHGCVDTKEKKAHFRKGLEQLLRVLEPDDILVHGYMPHDVFDDYLSFARFHRYPSEFEKKHPLAKFMEVE